MNLSPDQLLELIKGLDIRSALAVLAAKGVFDYTKSGYDRIKNAIRDKYNETTFAFVPNKKEAQKLKQFEELSIYNQIKIFVPNYRYIDLIRTGILIDFYHKRDEEGDRNRVSEIKRNILLRPNGSFLLKVTNLPTTKAFTTILRYFYELKMNGYSEKQLEEEFEKIVLEWQINSIFVKNANTSDQIISFCNTRMEARKSPIFVLGMRNATQKVEKAVDIMKKEELFSRNDYAMRKYEAHEGNEPRIEIMLYYDGNQPQLEE